MNLGTIVPQRSDKQAYIAVSRSASSEECFHPSHNLAHTGWPVWRVPLYPLQPSHGVEPVTSMSRYIWPEGSEERCLEFKTEDVGLEVEVEESILESVRNRGDRRSVSS